MEKIWMQCVFFCVYYIKIRLFVGSRFVLADARSLHAYATLVVTPGLYICITLFLFLSPGLCEDLATRKVFSHDRPCRTRGSFVAGSFAFTMEEPLSVRAHDGVLHTYTFTGCREITATSLFPSLLFSITNLAGRYVINQVLTVPEIRSTDVVFWLIPTV